MPKDGEKKHKLRSGEGGRVYAGTKPLKLGRRVPPVPDERDHKFKKSRKQSVLMAAATYRNWYDLTWRGDQGNTSQCVAYSALHRIENAPRTHTAAGPVMDPSRYYARAQELDEWPGSAYEGSSTRAGAKVAKENGWITEYRFASTLTDMIAAVMAEGPVVIGSYWYASMFNPIWKKCADGTYRWCIVIDETEGGIAGGHAWLVNGVNQISRTFRLLNSWGSTWGSNGRAWISFETMDRLLAEEGECVLYTEP